jgi:hypothetical protein
MKVFDKIGFVSGADDNGPYWEFEEPNTENKYGFKPAWTVRLTKGELYELFLTILVEFTRLPLPDKDNPPQAGEKNE